MGWERKRGKLRELNHLLRGATATSFLPAGRAELRRPPASVTSSLSTPTPGCRARRPGAWWERSSHPLNAPVFDPRRGAWSKDTPFSSRA